MDDTTRQALDALFATDSALYQSRGFQRRIGWGRKPALVNIDLANAWTREGNPFTCEGMDTIIPAVQELLSAFRVRGLPVIYTTTAYDVTDGANTDMGLWHYKIPAEELGAGHGERDGQHPVARPDGDRGDGREADARRGACAQIGKGPLAGGHDAHPTAPKRRSRRP